MVEVDIPEGEAVADIPVEVVAITEVEEADIQAEEEAVEATELGQRMAHPPTTINNNANPSLAHPVPLDRPECPDNPEAQDNLEALVPQQIPARIAAPVSAARLAPEARLAHLEALDHPVGIFKREIGEKFN